MLIEACLLNYEQFKFGLNEEETMMCQRQNV